MLDQRLRRWPNIKTAMDSRLMFWGQVITGGLPLCHNAPGRRCRTRVPCPHPGPPPRGGGLPPTAHNLDDVTMSGGPHGNHVISLHPRNAD